MNKQGIALVKMAQSFSQSELTDEQLLDYYLHLSKPQREEEFADTAQAAEMVGIAQRTIQLWIETGLIRAVVVGRKYKVYTTSLKQYLRSRVNQLAS